MDAERIQEIKDQELQGGPEPTQEDYDADVDGFSELLSRATDAAIATVIQGWDGHVKLGSLPSQAAIDRETVLQALKEVFWGGIRDAWNKSRNTTRYIPQEIPVKTELCPLIEDLFRPIRLRDPVNPASPAVAKLIADAEDDSILGHARALKEACDKILKQD